MNVNQIKERVGLPASLDGPQLAEVERLLADYNYVNSNTPARIVRDSEGIYDLEYIYPTLEDQLSDPHQADRNAIQADDVGVISTNTNSIDAANLAVDHAFANADLQPGPQVPAAGELTDNGTGE